MCFSSSHQQRQCVRLSAAHLDHSWILVRSTAARLGKLHRQETIRITIVVPSLLSLTPDLFTDRGYGTCEIDWAKATYSSVYRSYIISIFFFCFFIPVLIMLSCYISIINTVKRGNALSAEGDLSDRQRKIERDVTIVSYSLSSVGLMLSLAGLQAGCMSPKLGQLLRTPPGGRLQYSDGQTDNSKSIECFPKMF